MCTKRVVELITVKIRTQSNTDDEDLGLPLRKEVGVLINSMIGLRAKLYICSSLRNSIFETKGGDRERSTDKRRIYPAHREPIDPRVG